MHRGYSLGAGSQNKVSTVQPDMQLLVLAAMKIANTRKFFCPDFSITYGKRTTIEQFNLYKIGRKEVLNDVWEVTGKVVTNCDGYDTKSTHQSGNAVDFCAWVDGKSNFEPIHILAIATCFMEAASNLGLDMDWGGSFRSISDIGHIELIGEV